MARGEHAEKHGTETEVIGEDMVIRRENYSCEASPNMPASHALRHRAAVVPSAIPLYDAFMTERLYYTDAYLRTFDARIVDRADDGRTIYLDRTAFYPTSGGQPFDTGTSQGSPSPTSSTKASASRTSLPRPRRATSSP